MYCEHGAQCDKLETGPVLLDRYAHKPDAPLTIKYLCDQHTDQYTRNYKWHKRGWYMPTDREIMLRCAPEIASISRNSRENGQ